MCCRHAESCPARTAAASSRIFYAAPRFVTSSRDQDGVGFTADIGSTTLAVELYNLRTGKMLSKDGCINPQSEISTDIVGRIAFAEKPCGLETLQTSVLEALEALLSSVCAKAGISPATLSDGVVTGNTVMLHILFGKSPSSLGRWPFNAEWLAGCDETLLGYRVWIPPCIGAFTGADLTCALINAGFDSNGPAALLCDIGTNSEIAIRNGDEIFVASTAAGPAFERTGIRGSELLDTVARFLGSGAVSATGAIETDELTLDDGRTLSNGDIRAVQTAKAAIAAGISILLEKAEITDGDLTEVFLAGGFGSALNPVSAIAIGMIPPAPCAKKTPLGNAALSGAATLLLNPHRTKNALALARKAKLIELGGDADFSERFIKALVFAPTPL